jgi:phosphate transport system substrate-binding protein
MTKLTRWTAALLWLALLVVGWGVRPAAAQALMNGAGATFPYPIYSKWFDEYAKVDPSARFNYQSIGSGGGIRQITSRTVDFGATDGPMSDDQLKKAPGELLHIPTVLGAVVATYNLPGNPKLRFTPEILGDIFLGKLTKWNDAKLTAANPGVSLPDQPILVVHRSDGSGTTYIWVDYLAKVSREWEQKVGRGTSVNWPVGLGGKGNEGVAGQIKNTPGALGYVELAYAIKNNLPAASVKNLAGTFVEPTIESTTAAAAGAAKDMPADFRVSLTNPPGERAYPIASFTWLLVYKDQPDEAKGKSLVKFLWWMAHDGQKYTADLLYAPLPPQVVKQIEAKLGEITFRGKPLLAARERDGDGAGRGGARKAAPPPRRGRRAGEAGAG